MSDRDSDFGVFLVGFVVGGLVGAAVALLMAPQSGEETRAVIKDKSIEIKDRAVETAEEARVRAEKSLEEARKRAEDSYQDVRTRANELAALSKEKAAELQQRGQVVLDEQKARIEQAVETGKKAAQKKKPEVTVNSPDSSPETPAEA